MSLTVHTLCDTTVLILQVNKFCQDKKTTTKRGCNAVFLAAHDGLSDMLHILLRNGVERDRVRIIRHSSTHTVLLLLLTDLYNFPDTPRLTDGVKLRLMR